MNDDDDTVLTPTEAALYPKTSEQRLLRLARKVDIPSFRLGKRGVRFLTRDLRAMIKRTEIEHA
jgi:hypothetical protein